MIKAWCEKQVRRWAVSAIVATALLSSCGTPVSPAETLRYAAQRAERAGSVNMSGVTNWYPQNPAARGPFHGTLSWSPSPTAEFIMPLISGGKPEHTLARFTSHGEYISVPAGERAAMGGKFWGRRPYPRVAGDAALPGAASPPIVLAFPASFAALLSTANDLRFSGYERINARPSRHYTGTVNPATLTADPTIGLTDQLMAELRANFPDAGEHLDVWIDSDGYPVRIEARRERGYPQGSFSLEASYEPDVAVPVIVSEPLILVDYTDYGKPQPLTDPPTRPTNSKRTNHPSP